MVAMTNLNRMLCLAGGTFCITIGAIEKNFWWGGFGMSPRYGAPRLPHWLGKVLFILGGLWLFYEAAVHW
jgi:hypothetical protein